MRLKLPPKVIRIIRVLQENGFEAYAVGGCVRDMILGREPDDWDITTSARPQQVKKIFLRTVDTGLAHGTVTVLLGDDSFEVTTYRIDGAYEDHRHPSFVTFSGELAEDLRRRDFTINAMAYNREQGLVDLFGGMEDLQRKRIRCVGDARERFGEDALRILRAVRFSAQLGFFVEAGTEKALREMADSLAFVSAERIQTELTKLLLSSHPAYVLRLFDTGIVGVILPELDEEIQNSGYLEKAAVRLKKAPSQKAMRLAIFLYPLGEKKAAQTLRRLKFDNHTIDAARRLVRWHDYSIGENPAAVRRAAALMGEEIFPQALQMQKTYKDVSKAESLWREILEKGQCISKKSMRISGDDLISLGMKPGRAIGECLEELFLDVLENPEHNTKEYLLECAKRKLA